MVRRICKYGDAILRKKTKNVNFDDIKEKLPGIIKDMWDTTGVVKGLGLAGNQMGIPLRITVIEIKKDETLRRFVLLNPKIVAKSGRLYEEEGCLSFPGFYAKIKRFAKVKVTALNERGMPVEITGEGFLSRALQHEIDHLDGRLFIDRLPFMTRLKIRGVLRQLRKRWAKIDESKATDSVKRTADSAL